MVFDIYKTIQSLNILVEYEGARWVIPRWARYITTDYNGAIQIFEDPPIGSEELRGWLPNPGANKFRVRVLGLHPRCCGETRYKERYNVEVIENWYNSLRHIRDLQQYEMFHDPDHKQ